MNVKKLAFVLVLVFFFMLAVPVFLNVALGPVSAATWVYPGGRGSSTPSVPDEPYPGGGTPVYRQ